jgi:hypothetical protein
MEEEKHFPGQQAAETPADEQPKEETPKPEAPKEEAPKGDTPEPGEEAPKDEPKDEKPPEPEQPLPKKRSVYDDLKDTRKERNEARAAAEAEKARADAAEAEAARLKGDTPPAPKPEEKKPDTPADDLSAFAEENGLDAKGLNRLIEIITKRIPQAQLSEEEKADLASVREWRASNERQQEDQEVLSQATTVKAELGIADDAELQNVMKEIVRLAHTERFHDKEVGYIVWANKDALSKLVSPKKPSFESGGQQGEAAAEEEVDFSSGKVTPAQVERAVRDRGRSGGQEIRRPQ